MRRIAVITTFSDAGYRQYAKRMIDTWVANWPKHVTLVLYPDQKITPPVADNVRVIYPPNSPKMNFIHEWGQGHTYRGGAPYNYRFDAVKFCHKPFALYDFALRNDQYPKPYDGMIWLDADTVTHETITPEALDKIAPMKFDVQFLGREWKYTESGYIWFNLLTEPARDLLERWIRLYRTGQFRHQREWHDSFLFDVARKTMDEGRFNDLTGHMPRRAGGGHPFVNSFLGEYMDHHKGASRKVNNSPRKGDLFADHDTPYWKANAHAKHRHTRKT